MVRFSDSSQAFEILRSDCLRENDGSLIEYASVIRNVATKTKCMVAGIDLEWQRLEQLGLDTDL